METTLCVGRRIFKSMWAIQSRNKPQHKRQTDRPIWFVWEWGGVVPRTCPGDIRKRLGRRSSYRQRVRLGLLPPTRSARAPQQKKTVTSKNSYSELKLVEGNIPIKRDFFLLHQYRLCTMARLIFACTTCEKDWAIRLSLRWNRTQGLLGDVNQRNQAKARTLCCPVFCDKLCIQSRFAMQNFFEGCAGSAANHDHWYVN